MISKDQSYLPENWFWKFPSSDMHDCRIQTIIGEFAILTDISMSKCKSYICKLTNSLIPIKLNGTPVAIKTISHNRIDLAMAKHIVLCWDIATKQKDGE